MSMNNTHKGNIQIVDDTPENLDILASLLVKNGYEVRMAISGELALKSVRTDPPDLILLDIMMPDMSGFEVCEQLKANEQTRDIPVIFISALDELASKVKGFSVRGADYVTKPFQEEEVLVRVETHLALRNLQKRLEEKIVQLEEALAKVRILSGLLPICANCKKIRDGKGYWNQIEKYIESHSDATFSHGICEECADKLYGDQEWYRKARKNIIMR